MTDGPLLYVGAHGDRRLHFSWKAAALLGLFTVRLAGVKAAEHLADMSAQFSAWCEERGLPDPFD